MRAPWYRSVAIIAAISLVVPPPLLAQTPPPAAAEATVFNNEQLDALLAPIALYPDALLAQTLMASTYPLQVVDAERWLQVPGNKSLAGDALTAVLAQQSWDPSVKSLVPFPQVLDMLSGKLDWMQQLGYVFATQQADVMNAVQRLRQQAQAAGYLKTNEQQRVVVENSAIVIEPAMPQTVYVPVYSPTVVYGSWPYPAYPPVYIPPPPGYIVGNAFLTGLAFAGGVAVVGSLWGWARPSWHGRNVNVNVNHYNNINVNRPPINSAVWRAPAAGAGGRPGRPPVGPVGAPGRPAQSPANGRGRPNAQVPGSAVNRPSSGARPGQGVNVQRPTGQSAGSVAGQRSGGSAGVNRPSTGTQRSAGAAGSVNTGARAGQTTNRGAVNRPAQSSSQVRSGNAARAGGAAKPAAKPRAGGANPGR